MLSYTSIFATATLSISLGLGIIYWLPKCIIRFIDRNTNFIHFFIPNNRSSISSSDDFNCVKNILLTFDDVPYDQDSFRKILDLLRNFKQKAIFFVISSQINEDNYSLLIRAVQEGHCLSNHGMYNHYHCFRSYKTVKYEIETCQSKIKMIYYNAGREYPKKHFFRPGGGIMNKTIQNVCNELDMIPLLGSVYPHDPHVRSCDLNLWYIQYHLEDNDILILHDRVWTPILLEKLFEWMSNNNFRTVNYSFLESALLGYSENYKEIVKTWLNNII
uniref:NodB homology domain-containing protein n=1 Tax=viral metagenome TaxID=1070528 RepID=A0A6C0E853_9ZZZZ